MSSFKYIFASILLVFLVNVSISNGQLSSTFYDTTCPGVSNVIENFVKQALKSDPRIAASLIRLHFHDCFVQGCDGSILLDNSAIIVSEKQAVPNNNSVRGYDLIDMMKTQLEIFCPGVVSCSDIVTIASQKGVTLSGGPTWKSLLGRRDGRTANRSIAEDLPSPFENLNQLKAKFGAHKMDSTDLVALSGAHTFGRAACLFIQNRVYNFQNSGGPDPVIEKTYLNTLRALCPQGKNITKRINFDVTTPNQFDNKFYSNLVGGKGLLESDQELFSTPGADTIPIVQSFTNSQTTFFNQFVKSMIKMGNLDVLIGTNGEIRSNCRVVNKARVIESNDNNDLVSSI